MLFKIQAMSELRSSLEANDLKSFEKILANQQNRIADEPFLMTYIEPLRRRMQEQVLGNLLKPFKSATLSFISSELNLHEDMVLDLLADMISDQRLAGQVDHVSGVVTLNYVSPMESIDSRKYSAMGALADGVLGITNVVVNKSVLL